MFTGVFLSFPSLWNPIMASSGKDFWFSLTLVTFPFFFYVYWLVFLFRRCGNPYGLAVRIPGFHPGGPGSTPGMGILLSDFSSSDMIRCFFSLMNWKQRQWYLKEIWNILKLLVEFCALSTDYLNIWRWPLKWTSKAILWTVLNKLLRKSLVDYYCTFFWSRPATH